ncbi:hypothetical protein [Oceanobacter mangrovi]|uniref:hypothetical protein n=1 Tax=Oceanobacter mangrovi TaxID=2862510 RepID=UPI001C8D273F|nr:hypothetical protein [Oceanobacter mangrovi]
MKVSAAWPLLAVGLTVLTGCASAPQMSPKGAAIYDALAADTRVRTWADSCTEVSMLAQRAAEDARHSWWNRNGGLVEGADYGLAWSALGVTGERQYTDARMLAVMTWDLNEKAEQEVDAALKNNPDREDTCIKQLNQFSQGDLDLDKQQQTYQQLLELQHFREAKGDALMMKEASVKNQTQVEYGRSFYVVEKLAKRYACPDAKVNLLRNNWPDEVYLATCSDAKSLLLRCEWGNCMIVD